MQQELVETDCVALCRVWFLLAWKERLLDIVVKIEQRRKVRLIEPKTCMHAPLVHIMPMLLHYNLAGCAASAL